MLWRTYWREEEHKTGGSMTTDSHVSGSSYETAKKIAPLDQGIIFRKEKKYVKGEMRTTSIVERRTTHLFASLPVCVQYRKWFPPKIVSLHVPNVGSP